MGHFKSTLRKKYFSKLMHELSPNHRVPVIDKMVLL